MLAICSCSFIIDYDSSEPYSTHIPSITPGVDVFPTLKGTVWKLENGSSSGDIYLYIDKSGYKYAKKSERRGVKPDRYPSSYIVLNGRLLPSVSPLSTDDTVIFKEYYNINKFIGFHLKSRYELYSADSTGSAASVITSLQNGTGDKWSLYY